MKKTKTENKDRIFTALVILTIMVVLLSMWAYSRYTESIEGKAKASIASWQFLVNDGSSITEDLDLLQTLEHKDGVKDYTMAPGTQGSFSVEIDATGSEVGVGYKVELKELSDLPQHLKFFKDAEREDPLTNVEGVYSVEGLIPYDPKGESMSTTVNIYWKWDYQTKDNDVNQNDKEDTDDSEKNISGKIVVSGWQVNPGTAHSTLDS